jgi:acetoin utilization deacetylase AcuC-like enzyme
MQTIFVDGDTYGNRFTDTAVRCASGCVCELVTVVCGGLARHGLALVRPPGHHVDAHTCMGFGWVNHVAVGTRVRSSIDLTRAFALIVLRGHRSLNEPWEPIAF